MKRTLTISSDPIDEAALVAQRRMSSAMGAAVYFTGVVREMEGARTLRGIDYEAFRPMAEHQFHLIFSAMAHRWPIESVRVVHRIGFVPVNEPSLWVEVIAPHRGEAFAACQFLIEEMKAKVTIWKNAV
jgi:molybdopterin synthase catalytic subunit